MSSVPSTASSEASAYALLERLRWGGAPSSCPHCGATGRCYYLQPTEGHPRRTRTGALSGRRVWKCASCRRQFSVLVGTILQGTRISLDTWIGVVTQCAEPGARPSVLDVAARYGVSRAAARQVLRRVELALTSGPSLGVAGW
jgi:transposase-like protein